MTHKPKALRSIALRACQSLLFLALAVFFGCRPVKAQFVGYTSPQTVQQTLASNVACTGAPQIFTAQNLGQTQHYIYLTANIAVTSITADIEGVDAAGVVYRISDVLMVGTFSQTIPSLTASGYYPKIQIRVICLPSSIGNFTLQYSGASATSNVIAGGYQVAQIDKSLATIASTGASLISPVFQAPFGVSTGTLYFQYAVASGATGSTLTVNCYPQAFILPAQVYTFALANVTTLQTFAVPQTGCSNINVVYTAGSATTGTYNLDYIFQQEGFGSLSPSSYAHVTTTTATVVKAGPGVLQTLIIGTPAVGTVTLFDLAPAACTATPSTNVVSVITATVTMNPPVSFQATQFNAGICLKASVAMDLTAVYQ